MTLCLNYTSNIQTRSFKIEQKSDLGFMPGFMLRVICLMWAKLMKYFIDIVLPEFLSML